MNTKIVTFAVGLIILFGFFFVLLNNQQSDDIKGEEKEKEKVVENIEKFTNAEKIEVVHFHGTQQCWACVTLGELALKTIEQEFEKEKDEGIISFDSVNVDSPENSELVKKYQARGSSLFINAIIDGEDNIEENIDAWRYINNESGFIDYLSTKLNNMLGE